MDKKELEKYYSMEERQKRLNLEIAPDSDENRKKRASVLAKESANYGKLQKQFEKENFGKGGGGGGMFPDTEKVPGKRPLKMKKGGTVSASKRADGVAIKGKTKGRFV